jgi:hypothetical protein
MMHWSSLLLTFACGAGYEAACVYWTHYSEKGRPFMTGSCAMVAALLTCIGLGEALHQPAGIAAYVAGFGFGSTMGVFAKRYLR